MDNLIELTKQIAAALGPEWTATNYEDEGGRAWRTRLVNGNSVLFISNTWAGKGRLYIGGHAPDGIKHETIRNFKLPSITVNPERSADQIARDIRNRLLPEYTEMVSRIQDQHEKDTKYAADFQAIRLQVAEVLNVPLRDTDTEVIRGLGNIDVQVCSPTSIRLSGHMLYLSLDQLRRMKQAVPELFEREKP